MPQCAGFRELADRDIPIIVSAGNHRREIGWPANGWFAFSVGGTDITGDGLGQASYWDEDSGLPPGPDPANRERGSNRGPEQDFVAPARRVLSAFVSDGQWANRCTDTVPQPFPPYPAPNSFQPPGDGEVFPATGPAPENEAYEWCTGTSMSAPLVAAVAALVRSVNPLLERDQVEIALRRSAVALPGIPQRDHRIGWGLPQAYNALLEGAGQNRLCRPLGRSAEPLDADVSFAQWGFALYR